MDGVEKGYNFEQLIVFIFLSIIVGQLKSSWVTSSQMILEIRQGLINKYLIRPISYFWYHLIHSQLEDNIKNYLANQT